MDGCSFWDATLDPERRVLKTGETEDARMASEVTEMRLVGSEVVDPAASLFMNMQTKQRSTHNREDRQIWRRRY